MDGSFIYYGLNPGPLAETLSTETGAIKKYTILNELIYSFPATRAKLGKTKNKCQQRSEQSAVQKIAKG